MKNLTKKWKVILSIVCGSFIGFVNGFFGGGGGMLCVPILSNIFGLDEKQSHATTLCVIFPLCLVSSFVYIYNNNLNFLQLLYVSLGSVVGSIVGAVFLKKFNSKVVQCIFAVIMLVAGIKMVI